MKPPGRFAIGSAVIIALVVATLAGLQVIRSDSPKGDPGRLSEATIALPDHVPVPVLVDATAAWGLDDVDLVAAGDQMAGGVAIADVDGDGRNELILANGDVVVLRWSGSGFGDARSLGLTDAIGVSAADVDLDGFADLLVATAADADAVYWGGHWATDGSAPEVLDLAMPGPSSGLIAAELSGDGEIDIVRLGRARGDVVFPDILWTSAGGRRFAPVELPSPERISLAGEVVDVDGDGLLDIWITRDVGWARGGDTVLSRQGDPDGRWVDISLEIGAQLEVDGMGITVADLDGDRTLDAYVSDLGDNELLLGSDGGFEVVHGRGVAHIRPTDAPDSVISSSWGSGALDVNLDGVIDLIVASGGFPDGMVPNKIEGSEIAVAEAPAVLIGRGDGTFADVWDQLDIDLQVVARGMAVGDLDRDGDDDVVIIDRRGSIHVLRNDTHGPAIAVVIDPTCGAPQGQVVTVETAAGSYQRLVAPHGYASSHAAEMIVGEPEPMRVAPELAGRNATPIELGERAPGRRLVALECG